jgi:hypothetical protein
MSVWHSLALSFGHEVEEFKPSPEQTPLWMVLQLDLVWVGGVPYQKYNKKDNTYAGQR